jgi:hypothetical protein
LVGVLNVQTIEKGGNFSFSSGLKHFGQVRFFGKMLLFVFLWLS